jgi:hypothetical protein
MTFGSADSAPTGHLVTWMSAAGQKAVFSGGTTIAGSSFTLCTTADTVCNSGANNVFKVAASLGTVLRELYVCPNGTGCAHRLRAKSADGPAGWTQTSTGYTMPTTIDGRNPTNIEVTVAGGFPNSATGPGWQIHRLPALSVSGTTLTMNTNVWNIFKVFPFSPRNSPFWLENDYSLLASSACGATAGCWYYDAAATTLYYKPVTGETIANATIVAPQTVDPIVANGLANVTFSRLTWAYFTWPGPNDGNGYVSEQNGYRCRPGDTVSGGCSVDSGGSTFVGATGPMDGALTFAGAGTCKNLTFDHNLFTHIGSRPLFFQAGCQNVTLTGNDFQDNGGGAVQFGEASDHAQATASLQTAGLSFVNNRCGSATAFEYGEAGCLFVMNARDSVADHNEINDSPWAPLTWGWGWVYQSSYATGNSITNNKIINPCQSMFDCGNIYTGGGGTGVVTTVSGNYGANNTNTRMNGCLYPDEGANTISFTGNVCEPGTGTSTFSGTVDWLYIWIAQIFNITATGNFNTNPSVVFNNGTGTTTSGNTAYTLGSPPAGAVTIINNAGIQAGVTPGP